MTGGLAEEAYRRIHVDKAFIGVGGLDLEDGLTDYNLEGVSSKRLLMKSAQQRIIVADGSKFGRTAFVSFGSLDMVDIIITDDTAPEHVVQALRDMGIEVLIAN
jgi:DeoR/GlpR family transcriptional regulator of sugar metabolism